jgi:hypothetical protein
MLLLFDLRNFDSFRERRARFTPRPKPNILKQTYKELIKNTDYALHFPEQASRSHKNTSISFVESSHRLPNLDLQHNGLELTCGARFTAPLCRPPRSAGDVRLNDVLGVL